MEDEYTKLYLEELKRLPVLERKELDILLSRLPDRAAGEQIINGNLSYVANLADEYAGPHTDAADLVQEGSMALTLLVNHYQGGDFERLREKAVRTAMEAYCDSQRKNEQIEEKLTTSINVMNRVTTELAEELGREATLAEVAEKMKMPEDEIRILMKEALNAVNADSSGKTGKK